MTTSEILSFFNCGQWPFRRNSKRALSCWWYAGWELWKKNCYLQKVLHEILICFSHKWIHFCFCTFKTILLLFLLAFIKNRFYVDLIREEELESLFLPYTALAGRVHSWSDWTAISLCKIFRVGKRADNADYARRMNWTADLCECILRPHRPAPDLCIVQEEELVMGEIKTGKRRFFAMNRYPLFVSPKALL